MQYKINKLMDIQLPHGINNRNKTVLFIIAIYRIKWLRVNFIQNLQDLSEENFKTLLTQMMTLVNVMFYYVLG